MSEENVTQVDLSGGEDDGELLDNFFKKKSKKGKKRKKTKPDKGIILTEENVFEIEKTKKTEVEKVVEEEKDIEENTNSKDQGEWLEFEDDSNRDYSDLKIQNLQIEENQEDDQAAEQPPEYNDAGELIPPKVEEGPWKVQVSTSNAEQVTPEPKVQTEPVKRTGAYVPPRVRAEQGKGPLRRGRAQKAPEISNENDFPSLSAAVQDTETHKGFEVVKTGVKTSTPWRSKFQQQQHQNLELGNKFSALNNG